MKSDALVAASRVRCWWAVVFAEAVALGLIEPHRQADIVVRLQSFAAPPVMAARSREYCTSRRVHFANCRTLAVGNAAVDGHRCFLPDISDARNALYSSREATSNICAEQASH